MGLLRKPTPPAIVEIDEWSDLIDTLAGWYPGCDVEQGYPADHFLLEASWPSGTDCLEPTAGQWDSNTLRQLGGVSSLNGYFYVWYGGYNGTLEKIGAARTTNYTSFTKCPSNPVIDLVSPETRIRDPSVMYWPSHSTKIWVYFQANDGTETGWPSIGLARGNDPWAALTRYGSYVLTKGASGEFDDWWCTSPVALKVGSQVYLFYEAREASGSQIFSIGLARSRDGLNFTKLGRIKDHTGAILRNPVNIAWDLVPTCAFKLGSTFYLFGHYRSSTSPDAAHSFVATSTDLTHWTWSNENPYYSNRESPFLVQSDYNEWFMYTQPWGGGTLQYHKWVRT